MSARFPFPTKFRLSWWRANADEPSHPDFTAEEWARRNPWHNFTWYVLGCADRRFLRLGSADNSTPHVLLQFWPPWICPLIALDTRWFFLYLGWRYNGPFGGRFILKAIRP